MPSASAKARTLGRSTGPVCGSLGGRQAKGAIKRTARTTIRTATPGAGNATPKKRTRRPAAPSAASEARAHRARSGRRGEALFPMRAGSAADRRRNQRALRIHPAPLTVIEDVCRKYACACTVKTADQASAADREEHCGSQPAGAGDREPRSPIICRCTGRRRFQAARSWTSRARVCAAGWRNARICWNCNLWYAVAKESLLPVQGSSGSSVKVLDPEEPFARTGKWPYSGDAEPLATRRRANGQA